MRNATEEWLSLLGRLLTNGKEVKPRGKVTLEKLVETTVIDMRYPVVDSLERKLSFKFMCGEAWWILSGDDRVETIKPYNIRIANFSDDDVTFYGAYGPRVVAQLTHVIEALRQDEDSRQAVMSIWRANPPKTKDVPCTCLVQWFIRDGKLYCHDTMRSSDAWLGWPYDVFNFSMLSGYILIALNNTRAEKLKLGCLYLTAGSQHLYETDWDAANKCHSSSSTRLAYKAFDPSEFTQPQQLVTHLKLLADREFGLTQHEWLHELSQI